MALFSTFAKTADNKIYDIGLDEHPPEHRHAGNGLCNACKVIDAFMAEVSDDHLKLKKPKENILYD